MGLFCKEKGKNITQDKINKKNQQIVKNVSEKQKKFDEGNKKKKIKKKT